MAAEAIDLRPTIDRAWLERAAAEDPITHAFALWDLDRYPGRVRFVSAVGPATTEGYLLVWLGHPSAPIVHWFGGTDAAQALADALPPRPLVAIVPEEVGTEVERARGPVIVHRLLGLVAEGDPGREAEDFAPGVRPLTGADRAYLTAWASRHREPVVAEYPGLDPDLEAIWGFFDGPRLLGVVRAAVRLSTVWLLAGVYVEPVARGRGIGLALVRAALSAGRRAGATVALYVREDRPAARTVYERAGFRPQHRRLWIDAGADLEP